MQDPKDRPQRHLVLLARELARLDIDIAALSGARFAEQGCFMEDGAAYTPLLVWDEQGRAPPLRCTLHDQNFYRQKTADLASCSFRPHHVPETPNPGQQVCHCPWCVRTKSAG